MRSTASGAGIASARLRKESRGYGRPSDSSNTLMKLVVGHGARPLRSTLFCATTWQPSKFAPFRSTTFPRTSRLLALSRTGRNAAGGGAVYTISWPCRSPSRRPSGPGSSSVVPIRSRRRRSTRPAPWFGCLAALDRHFAACSCYAGAGPRTDIAEEVRLTPRQLVVLTLLADGLTATAIGHRLLITERTVHKHLERIYAKLGVTDRLGAVMRAQRIGLLPDQSARSA